MMRVAAAGYVGIDSLSALPARGIVNLGYAEISANVRVNETDGSDGSDDK